MGQLTVLLLTAIIDTIVLDLFVLRPDFFCCYIFLTTLLILPDTPCAPLSFVSQPLRSVETISAEVDARSLYVAPFPVDATLDQLEAFFSAATGPVACIRLRKHAGAPHVAFKGSVFVEFASVEGAEKVWSACAGMCELGRSEERDLKQRRAD